MSKNTIFKGVATALVTPLNENGIDYESFGRLIDWQIEQGINALVICGTTGEASTLTDEEHRNAIEFAVKRANKRVPIIAGTGANDTAYAVSLTKFACEVGADACLVVTPYYNKATQNGLYQHFKATADSIKIPVILYNIQGRTGVNIQPATIVKLVKDVENIVAVKEASGNISQIAQILALADGNIDLYSGNDDQIVPILSLGGKGVISVLSNVMPEYTHDICETFFNGDVKKSAKMQLDALPLINALFSEVNPIPVKEAMFLKGLCGPDLRLPLTRMEPAHAEVLKAEMEKMGVI